MISRNGTTPSAIWSRQWSNARMVNGDSQIPPIIISRPASIRFAIAISPSRDSNSTLPISRKYMRTGSSVPETSLSDKLPAARPSSAVSSSPTPSALSTTETPISLRDDMKSSICSDVYSSAGKAAFNSSCVTKPRSLPSFISVLMVCWAASRLDVSPASGVLCSDSTCFFALLAIEVLTFLFGIARCLI